MSPRPPVRFARTLPLCALILLASVSTGAATAAAATVTYILDVGTDTFTLAAQVSPDDNLGLVFYGVPLKGTVLTLDHSSPYVINTVNWSTAGFSLLRSPDIQTPTIDPTVAGSQDVITGPVSNFIYGIGQEPGTFPPGIVPAAVLPDPTSATSWSVPVVLATGTYDPSQGPLTFDTSSLDLVANVFEARDQRRSPQATVETSYARTGLANTPPIPGPEDPIRSSGWGEVVQRTFNAVDVEDPTGPFMFQDLDVEFRPLRWGPTNPVDPLSQASLDMNTGEFLFDTRSMLEGRYIFTWYVKDPDGAISEVPGTLQLRILYWPEPASVALFGPAMVGLVGFARRRNNAGRLIRAASENWN